MQNTKQIILSASLIAVFILFVIYEKQGSTSADSTLVTQVAETSTTNVDKTSSITMATEPNVAAPPAPLAQPTPRPIAVVPQPSPSPTTQATSLKNGNFTGKIADAYFGDLQVEAVIRSGKISDVKFLKYPNDQPQSLEISNRSMPKLKSEAISTQSAKVDIISGATQTSEAFNESLSDALLKARV